MARGRPKKPTALKILTGTYRKDRDGAPNAEPKPAGSPKKPKDLDGEAGKFWDLIVPQLVELKIATALDAPELARLCRWWAIEQKSLDYLDGLDADLVGSSEWYRVQLQAGHARNQWDRIAARFGMSPADRAKLRIEASSSKPRGVRARDRFA